MAIEKNITMKEFNGTDYDTLYPKTIAAQIPDVYSKTEILTTETLAEYGLTADKLPNDVFQQIKTLIDSRAKIQTGSYVGTGTYGNTKLNSLTFNFFPKAIFIIPVATSMGSYSGQFGAFLYGVGMCSTRLDGGAGSTKCNVTITGWGTNTIKWFGASSDYQLNNSKKEYRYVAIG